MTTYEEADEYCPHCDNQYVRTLFRDLRRPKLTPPQIIEAKEPQAMLGVEGEDARMDARFVDRGIIGMSDR